MASLHTDFHRVLRYILYSAWEHALRFFCFIYIVPVIPSTFDVGAFKEVDADIDHSLRCHRSGHNLWM